MLAQSDEHKAMNLGAGSRRAASTADRSVSRSYGRDRAGNQSLPTNDFVATPSEREAAYALLAEQCRSRIDALAPRQREVLAGLVAGRSNKQMAHILGISSRTIEIYRAAMMDRLKVRTLAQALHIAFVAGLMPPDTVSPGTG